MSIVPGEDPRVDPPPLLNEEPLPPGVEDLTDDVDEIEQRIRRRGPDDVAAADEAADAVEGDRDHEEPDGVRPGSRSDAAHDPTTDPGADAPV